MNAGHTLAHSSAEPRRVAALGLLLVSCLYLVPFVERGWVPLDEGMVGQAAERVLHGQLPHVDYEEPYPGALSYLYAAVFRLTGVDAAHLRWTVFAAAVAGLIVLYLIVRRMLSPVAAAITAFVSLVWSYPNYLSSLPSWWILLFALVSLWAIVRYVETGRLEFAAVAGVSTGMAFVFKQTGLYLLPPVVMALLASHHPGQPVVTTGGWRWRHSLLRAAIGVTAAAFVLALTWSRLGSGEFVYLVLPIVASCAVFLAWERTGARGQSLNWRAALLAAGCAVVPLAALLAPHVAAGEVPAFIYGTFVLPQQRLDFTSLEMRPASQIIAGAAGLAWLLWSPPSLGRREIGIVNAVRWAGAVALPLLALRSPAVYAFIWEAVRGTAALVPVVAAWLLISGRIVDSRTRILLFASSAMAAWLALSQFPFAAPIYFLYVAPLALVAGILAISQTTPIRRLSEGPTVTLVLLFALLSLNRGYVWNVGAFHEVQDLRAPLALPRADLSVSPEEAAIYRRVITLVTTHLGDGELFAGPDTPDIYFLSGRFSPSGRLFDFFSPRAAAPREQQLAEWTSADVIVMFHGQRFSPSLADGLVSSLRGAFPRGESVPPFEVRWR